LAAGPLGSARVRPAFCRNCFFHSHFRR
jgi:hypothetical protein